MVRKDASLVYFHRVGRGVAVLIVMGVPAQEIDRLFSVQVDDAHHLALLDNTAPAGPGGNGCVLDNGAVDIGGKGGHVLHLR